MPSSTYCTWRYCIDRRGPCGSVCHFLAIETSLFYCVLDSAFKADPSLPPYDTDSLVSDEQRIRDVTGN